MTRTAQRTLAIIAAAIIAAPAVSQEIIDLDSMFAATDEILDSTPDFDRFDDISGLQEPGTSQPDIYDLQVPGTEPGTCESVPGAAC